MKSSILCTLAGMMLFQHLKICYGNLIGACMEGNKQVIHDLIGVGHDPNVIDEKSGWTPLIFATTGNDIHLMEVLILAGADVNKGCNDGWTPLMFACVHKFYDAAALLVRYGANPYQESKNGMDVGKAAELSEDDRILDLIEEAQQNYHRKTMYDSSDVQLTRLLEACHNGVPKVVDEILKSGSVSINAQSPGGWTPLILATEAAKYEVMELLLVNGADPNVADNDGWTPILFAAHQGDERGVDMLLNFGADLFLETKDGHHFDSISSAEGFDGLYEHSLNILGCRAVSQGNLNVLHTVITKGATPNLICGNANRYSPLLTATRHRDYYLMKLLLESGADVNHAENDGWTAIIFAAVDCFYDGAALLIEHGADLSVKTVQGLTALDATNRCQAGSDKDRLQLLLGGQQEVARQDANYQQDIVPPAQRQETQQQQQQQQQEQPQVEKQQPAETPKKEDTKPVRAADLLKQEKDKKDNRKKFSSPNEEVPKKPVPRASAGAAGAKQQQSQTKQPPPPPEKKNSWSNLWGIL